MKCPFCEADKPQLISQFGSQLLFSQYRCRACGTYFEGLRDDRQEDTESSPYPAREAPRSSSQSASLQTSLLFIQERETRSPNV